MQTFFKDLKVVEIANVLAGPSVGMFFAELGAEVIKIENKKTGGDITRRWKLPVEDSATPVSSYYASVNWGKKIIMLDMLDQQDQQQAYKLIAESDILITNFRKGEGEKFGLNANQIENLNKNIIHGNISAYGDDDARPGFDLVIQAESGFMSMNGTADSGPIKMPVALIDVLAGHQLKEALLLALIRRFKTGEGATVSVSLFDAAIASLANQASNYLNCNHVPGLQGSLHPNIAPYGEILTGSDGKKIILAVGTDKQFTALCELLGIREVALDTRYADNRSRVKERKSLFDLLVKASRQWESVHLLKSLHKAGIPAGRILDMEEVFNNPIARKKVLDQMRDGKQWHCVSSVAFQFGL